MATGRPRLKKSEKLAAKLVVSVNDEFYKRTRSAASTLSMQLSDYLRQAIEFMNDRILGGPATGPAVKPDLTDYLKKEGLIP